MQRYLYDKVNYVASAAYIIVRGDINIWMKTTVFAHVPPVSRDDRPITSITTTQMRL